MAHACAEIALQYSWLHFLEYLLKIQIKFYIFDTFSKKTFRKRNLLRVYFSYINNNKHDR